MDKKEIYVIGASGHAKVILALLRECGYKCPGLYDDDETLWGKTLAGVKILGAISDLPDVNTNTAIIAIGDNEIREKIAGKFKNIKWITLIHPYSWVAPTAKIEEGCVVFAGAVVQPDVVIGKHTIINTSASVDHDCKIGSFTHIAPGCHVCGAVKIGSKVLLGVGSSVKPCMEIADEIVVGAGGVVVSNLMKKTVYCGMPAKQTNKQTNKH